MVGEDFSTSDKVMLLFAFTRESSVTRRGKRVPRLHYPHGLHTARDHNRRGHHAYSRGGAQARKERQRPAPRLNPFCKRSTEYALKEAATGHHRNGPQAGASGSCSADKLRRGRSGAGSKGRLAFPAAAECRAGSVCHYPTGTLGQLQPEDEHHTPERCP